MKAPDKIYINIPGNYWHPGTDKKVNIDIEYIRKEALLEWANYYLKEPPASLLDEGVDMAMKLLIDKLNSI